MPGFRHAAAAAIAPHTPAGKVFLLPTLVISLYAIALNSEPCGGVTTFQASWVRCGTVLAGSVMGIIMRLLNYRKINPISFHYAGVMQQAQVRADLVMASGRFGQDGRRARRFGLMSGNDTILMLSAVLILYANILVYDTQLLSSLWSNPISSTPAWSAFLCFILSIPLLALGNYVMRTEHKFVIYYNVALLLVNIFILSVELMQCGNAGMNNLNSAGYFDLLPIQSSNFTLVYSAIQPALTFVAALRVGAGVDVAEGGDVEGEEEESGGGDVDVARGQQTPRAQGVLQAGHAVVTGSCVFC
ncbi:hypothetical protein GUITHDRAFT_140552 [Guillardia theta CCMP2712]|uniref:Uncharacterized protein n=1 Tax=Guillardia theta (strain CCMP2712) TaxID=905079 RepID=L1J4H5_GUITC|nr:hypothetical protein GUITHDRAFT_140552 [Guillardia theta CCMP2712]EKX43227.1 hypothetical protein GUITHDRAFT_140552 [Guillardia theta CCMP2712]|eukprot:XP_005830207.1 hypothetical protein GUITHDRAFT_140552 [Guillardia theta CCMP2712]